MSRFKRVLVLVLIALTAVADVYLVAGLVMTHRDAMAHPGSSHAFLPFETNEIWSPNSICVLLVVGWTLGLAIVAGMDPLTREKEMRCRKCAHILRGLREPRCPECGESI